MKSLVRIVYGLKLKADPENLTPLVWTAAILRQMGRSRHALDTLTSVLAQDPTVAAAHAGIAMIRMDRGDLNEARREIERAATDRNDAALDEARSRLLKLEAASLR